VVFYYLDWLQTCLLLDIHIRDGVDKQDIRFIG